MSVKVRKGISNDFPQVLELIQELAIYEKCPDAVNTSIETMKSDADYFSFFVAEIDNKIVGTAIYFPYYSTWEGRCIYLEDIIVTEKHRQKGIGKLLFDKVVTEANTFGAKRLMWQVLDWNEPAIAFYKKMNTHFDSEWLNCKLTEKQIRNYKC